MNNNYETNSEQLNAFVDGELNAVQRENLLSRLDDEPGLRGELCDIQRVKDLMQFSYPLISEKQDTATPKNKMNFGAMAASLLFVLSLGFLGGYLTFNQKLDINNQLASNLNETAVGISDVVQEKQKIIIYLGSSQKEKFDETLDKAESLLTKYKKEGTEVYVVTSAGGIDLLRTSNTDSKGRIKTLSSLYKSLHFVACNNQIYQLHKKGKDIKLVDEAEVAPSAVQFVVDHLTKGWKYIAI
jgi:intracellular sulfur oxidation DsrE/DsrF family protein